MINVNNLATTLLPNGLHYRTLAVAIQLTSVYGNIVTVAPSSSHSCSRLLKLKHRKLLPHIDVQCSVQGAQEVYLLVVAFSGSLSSVKNTSCWLLGLLEVNSHGLICENFKYTGAWCCYWKVERAKFLQKIVNILKL